MVALGILGEFGLMVDRVEVDRPGPSYTADTLRLLRAREPDILWTLLVGTDAAKDLPLWRESATIPTLAEIVVFNRPGSGSSPISGLRSVDVPGVDISATAVRARVNSGRSIRYWVPDAVLTYIAAHRLYRDEES